MRHLGNRRRVVPRMDTRNLAVLDVVVLLVVRLNLKESMQDVLLRDREAQASWKKEAREKPLETTVSRLLVVLLVVLMIVE